MGAAMQDGRGLSPHSNRIRQARSIGWLERFRLWFAGRRDARNGLISLDGDGRYASPMLSVLAYDAHRSISANLDLTSEELRKIQRELDRCKSSYQNLLTEYDSLCAQIKAGTEAASVPHDGDEGATDGSLSRRMARRVGQATGELYAQRDAVFAKLCKVADEASTMEDAHRECAFLSKTRLEATETLYYAKCFLYLRAAHAEGVGSESVHPLDRERVDASIQAFQERTARYDFTRHLHYV